LTGGQTCSERTFLAILDFMLRLLPIPAITPGIVEGPRHRQGDGKCEALADK